MKPSTSFVILLLWPIMVLRVGTTQNPAGCELYDCSIARPSDRSASSNCTVRQFEKFAMNPTQDYPAQTESMGAVLDVTASVRDKSCLRLIASLTLTVTKAETFSLNFICNGSTFFSKAFLLEDGCLRPYPDINPRKCTVFRRERIRITDNADGLTVANLDSTGRLIGQSQFTLANASTGNPEVCDCRMFEKITKKYDECITANYHGITNSLVETYVSFSIVGVLLVAFVTAILVLTSSKVE